MLTLVDPVDSRRLGITRVVIGTAAFIRAWVALPVLLKLAEPRILTAPNFDWFPEPSTAIAYTLVGLWLASAALVAIGWRLPVSGSVLFACLVFMLAFDLQTYSNHLYLMAWLVALLVIADAGAGFNLSKLNRPVPRWPILLMCSMISIVYFFSAITKINETFLSGRILAGVLNNGLIQFPEALRTPLILSLVAGGAVLLEAFLAFGLWIPHLRRYAYVGGVLLHLPMILFLGDTLEILVFAMLMWSVYSLFAVIRPAQPEPAAV